MANRATLYIVFDNDGGLECDVDRDAAIERFGDYIGGEYRVAELDVTLPTWEDIQARARIPADKVGPVETPEE